MSANSFGHQLVLTTFGESHGHALGAIVSGCPAGVIWDLDLLVRELDRRRPGSSKVVSGRNEQDIPEVLSGVFEGKTLGTPIAVIVRNQDAKSADYQQIANDPRAGHADDLWKEKFGHSDHRGGGRSSGRETLARVIGGSVAKMILRSLAPEMKIVGFAKSIGPFGVDEADVNQLLKSQDLYPADKFTARFPSLEKHKSVEKLLLEARDAGQSYGGIVEIRVTNTPRNLGQPVFHKLKADLASAFMSIGATTSFEIGAGLEATQAEGSVFHRLSDEARYGGIRGGISTGEPLVLRVGFKPTSSVLDVARSGRHDPCIVPRAIPVLEAMTALIIADHLLLARCDKI